MGLALVCACGRGAPGEPASTTTTLTTTGAAPSSPVVPLQATLHDDAWKLALRLDPRAPAGTLEVHGQPYGLTGVTLVLLHEELVGSVTGDAGKSPAQAARAFRLRFSIDECEHEPVTPAGKWPGPCGYLDGQPRPQKLALYEILVDVESNYWATGERHQIKAACVPRSGAGPSCKLEGSATPLAP